MVVENCTDFSIAQHKDGLASNHDIKCPLEAKQQAMPWSTTPLHHVYTCLQWTHGSNTTGQTLSKPNNILLVGETDNENTFTTES